MVRYLAQGEPATSSRGRDRFHFFGSRSSLSVCVAAVAAALLWLPAEAEAACSPAAANNVDATCTGTTVNQAGGAPGTSAGAFGYGTGVENNVTVTVIPDASVTGATAGMFFFSGTVFNSGTIGGPGGPGIITNGVVTVTNSGTISSPGGDGIFAGAGANIINSGTIKGAGGIAGNNFLNLTNTGSIATVGLAINFSGAATVINSGTITSTGGRGIFQNSFTSNLTVTNSGTITAALDAIWSDHANATVTNSGTISSAGGHGIVAAFDVTVTNSGTITANLNAVRSAAANTTVTNSGTITSGADSITGLNTTVVNSGLIKSTFSSVVAGTSSVVVTNSGTIMAAGAGAGVGSNGNVTVANSGTITGVVGIQSQNGIVNVVNSGTVAGTTWGILALNGNGNVTNSGVISGFGGTAAIQFAGNPDILTLLPGSTIIGAILLNGGGDTIDFRGGNHNLTFDTLAGATVTGTTPFVVSGNRAVAIDTTPFAMVDRNLLDFSRAVSSAVPQIEGSFTITTAAADSSSALAFAGPDGDASTLADDVAAIPGLSAYADGSTLPFKSPTAVYGNGTALWARAFVGERVQDEDGALLETHNRFYGGLIGGGWQARPNLRLGLFVGAGETRSQTDFYGETKSTLVFAGLTGRYSWGASFLRFGLQGGHSKNDSTRNINNNLVAGGIENATASFDGWYVTPEATFGHRFALGAYGGGAYTLTPSLTVRYLHASLDGYTETGTTAPLTVGDRSADSFEERGQLKLTRTQVFAPTEVLKTSLFGGVLADQRVGDDSVDATLLGQAIPFAIPGDDSVWGGFGGLGLEWRTGRVTLFASAEYLALSDSSSVISGQGGLRIAF
jgi:hypothetical protein